MVVRMSVKKGDIIVRGVNIEKFAKAFDGRCLETVINFIDTFGWDAEMSIALDELMRKHKLYQSVQSVETKKPWKKSRDPDHIEEPQEPRTPVGSCPRCGGVVRGMAVKACNKDPIRVGGIKLFRVFYKECFDCSYYSELFVKKTGKEKKLLEIEGD